LLDPAQPADLAYWNYPAALKPLGLNGIDEWNPKLANRKQITKLLKKYFRDPNRCGVTLLWVYVAEGGWTQSMQIQTSSGHEELDTLARALAWQMKWKPATAAGQLVSAWVELPIQFNNDGRSRDRD